MGLVISCNKLATHGSKQYKLIKGRHRVQRLTFIATKNYSHLLTYWYRYRYCDSQYRILYSGNHLLFADI